MYKLVLGIIFCSFFATANSDVEEVLNNFHQAAGDANYEEYINLLADNAVFLGTDSNERWTKNEFSAFVQPYFSQGKGWLYQPVERHISVTQMSNVVFFDELLENNSYGRCRGSGLLINTPEGWKILQYNLSIPLPNAIAPELVKSIKAYRTANQ